MKRNPIVRNLVITLVMITVVVLLGVVAKFGGQLVEKVLAVGTKELIVISVTIIVWSVVLGVVEILHKHGKTDTKKPEEKRKPKIKEEGGE